eukprot:maker-scaffold40_size501252-snap-gene-2.16 protein:Tk06167 transcript:maker-scaffold40_size501252-snap-gene-2.16-mRNA-1 annotation:"hypothetical protein DAPPUDRAFT_224483"
MQDSAELSGRILNGDTSWNISPSAVTRLRINLAEMWAPTMKLSGRMSPTRNAKHIFLSRSEITAFLLNTTVRALEGGSMDGLVHLGNDDKKTPNDLGEFSSNSSGPGEGLILSTDELLMGPEAFAGKSEQYLAQVIRSRFLKPPSGIKFVPKADREEYGQANQAQIIDKLLQGLTNGFFIESGAADGVFFSNSLFFEVHRNWSGILIEPNPTQYQALTKAQRNCYNLQGCLSMHKYSEEVSFLNAGHVGGVKAIKPGPSLAKQRSWTNYQKITFESQVQCFPLYTILMALDNPRVDLFSLDVEGAEIEVLQTIPWDKVDIGLVLVEVEHVDKQEVKAIMTEAGYELRHNVNEQDYIFVKK